MENTDNKTHGIKERNRIEPSAIIKDCVKMGRNNYVGDLAVLGNIPVHYLDKEKELMGVTIGHGNSIYAHSMICAGTIRDTVILNETVIGQRSIIGHDAQIGNNVKIMNSCVLNGFVRVNSNSFIGAGCVVRNRITIGFNCYVGQGSNVVSDIPDNSLGYGNPFKVVKKHDSDLKNVLKELKDWVIYDRYNFD